jgi:hypothetical protein
MALAIIFSYSGPLHVMNCGAETWSAATAAPAVVALQGFGPNCQTVLFGAATHARGGWLFTHGVIWCSTACPWGLAFHTRCYLVQYRMPVGLAFHLYDAHLPNKTLASRSTREQFK